MEFVPIGERISMPWEGFLILLAGGKEVVIVNFRHIYKNNDICSKLTVTCVEILVPYFLFCIACI